jgi:hypothetical protein
MAVNAADAWQQSGARPDRSVDRRVPPRAVPPRAAAPHDRPVDNQRPGDGGHDRGRSADYSAQAPQYARPPAPRRSGDPDQPGRPAARPHDRGPAQQDRPDLAADGRGAPVRAGRRPASVADTRGSRLRGMVAVLIMFVLTLGACGIDSLMGVGPGIITTIVLVAVTALAAFVVRRRDLLTVVVSPPLVFVAVLIVKIVATPSLPLSLKTFVPLVGLNLVSGFITMAVGLGTAVVVALIRLATRR